MLQNPCRITAKNATGQHARLIGDGHRILSTPPLLSNARRTEQTGQPLPGEWDSVDSKARRPPFSIDFLPRAASKNRLLGSGSPEVTKPKHELPPKDVSPCQPLVCLSDPTAWHTQSFSAEDGLGACDLRLRSS